MDKVKAKAGFKETEIGLIPEDWEVKLFGEVFEIIKSQSFSRNKLITKNTNLNIQNIHYGDIHAKFVNAILDFELTDVPYIIDKYVNEERNQYLQDGDIVIADASEDLIDIGKCVEIKNIKDRKVIGGLHTIVARDKLNVIEQGFGAFIFKNDGVLQELRSIATGMSVYGISKGNLKKLKIPIPTSSEQKAIAKILSTIQEAIQKQQELIDRTTELKKALMNKLFTEGTKGEKQKETEIGLVPESWEKIKIRNFGKCVTGNTPKTKIDEYWDNPEIDFITPADIGNTRFIYNATRKVSKKGYDVSRKLSKNTIVCVCIGSSIGKVGMTYKEDSCTNQQINSITCSKYFYPAFVYYQLNYLSDYWKSHSTPGPVPILSKGKFEAIEIITSTDILEQKKIASVLENTDKKIETHKNKKTALEALFKTTLHELMTGKRRVKDL